ncbi:MAG: hypothetical protein U0235_15955 [Polyangiaceae bacterium]
MLRFTFASVVLVLVGCGQAPTESLDENVPPPTEAPSPVAVAETATDLGAASSAPADAGARPSDAAASADAPSDAAMGAKCTELATSCCPIMVTCTAEISACRRVANAKNDAECGALLAGYAGIGCDHELDVPAPAYPTSATFGGCRYKGNHPGGAIP